MALPFRVAVPQEHRLVERWEHKLEPHASLLALVKRVKQTHSSWKRKHLAIDMPGILHS